MCDGYRRRNLENSPSSERSFRGVILFNDFDEIGTLFSFRDQFNPQWIKPMKPLPERYWAINVFL